MTEEMKVGNEVGNVIWFDQKKGFGFVKIITPNSEYLGKEIFVHFSSIQSENTFKKLFPGENVSLDVEKNPDESSNKEVKNFCEAKFGITFPMTEKVLVKGPEAHPFYIWAKKNHGESAVPKWNFHKIIIGKDGKVVDTFASITNPSSRRFIKALESLIEK